MSYDPNQKFSVNEFRPHPLLQGGITQTLAATFMPPGQASKITNRYTLELDDGDKIVLTENRPEHFPKGGRIVVLMHGLSGSEFSPYIVRLGRKLNQQGFLVIKVNLRSAGPGLGLARKPYHSGRSEDALSVLRWLKKTFPESPVTQVGFSLSANITIKMAGELEEQHGTNLDSCVAVSPPYDLYTSSQMIMNSSFKLFDRYFSAQLVRMVRQIEQRFSDIPKTHFPKKMNLIDFDNIYTAPQGGFTDAIDYYNRSSSKNFINNIQLPTLLIHAHDDPVVDGKSIGKLVLPKNVKYIETKNGGHVGFIGRRQFWVDEQIIRWIQLR